MDARIRRWFNRKRSQRRSLHGQQLKGQRYEATLPAAKPYRGHYPVRGNGPVSVENLHAKFVAQEQALEDLDDAAPPPITRSRRNSEAERPVSSARINRLRTTSLTSFRSITRRLSSGSLRSFVEAPKSKPTPQFTWKYSTPSYGSPYGFDTPTLLNREQVRSLSAFAPERPERPPPPRSAHVDLFEAISTAPAHPNSYRTSNQASGWRDYGEDVADRNLASCGGGELEPRESYYTDDYDDSVYAQQEENALDAPSHWYNWHTPDLEHHARIGSRGSTRAASTERDGSLRSAKTQQLARSGPAWGTSSTTSSPSSITNGDDIAQTYRHQHRLQQSPIAVQQPPHSQASQRRQRHNVTSPTTPHSPQNASEPNLRHHPLRNPTAKPTKPSPNAAAPSFVPDGARLGSNSRRHSHRSASDADQDHDADVDRPSPAPATAWLHGAQGVGATPAALSRRQLERPTVGAVAMNEHYEPRTSSLTSAKSHFLPKRWRDSMAVKPAERPTSSQSHRLRDPRPHSRESQSTVTPTASLRSLHKEHIQPQSQTLLPPTTIRSAYVTSSTQTDPVPVPSPRYLARDSSSFSQASSALTSASSSASTDSFEKYRSGTSRYPYSDDAMSQPDEDVHQLEKGKGKQIDSRRSSGSSSDAAFPPDISTGRHRAYSHDADKPLPEKPFMGKKLPDGFDLRDSEDTEVITHHAPGKLFVALLTLNWSDMVNIAVTHEVIKPQVTEIVQEQIHREIHTHDVYHRIQPILDVEVLPPKHYIPGPDGKTLIEVSEEYVRGLESGSVPGPNERAVGAIAGTFPVSQNPVGHGTSYIPNNELRAALPVPEVDTRAAVESQPASRTVANETDMRPVSAAGPTGRMASYLNVPGTFMSDDSASDSGRDGEPVYHDARGFGGALPGLQERNPVAHSGQARRADDNASIKPLPPTPGPATLPSGPSVGATASALRDGITPDEARGTATEHRAFPLTGHGSVDVPVRSSSNDKVPDPAYFSVPARKPLSEGSVLDPAVKDHVSEHHVPAASYNGAGVAGVERGRERKTSADSTESRDRYGDLKDPEEEGIGEAVRALRRLKLKRRSGDVGAAGVSSVSSVSGVSGVSGGSGMSQERQHEAALQRKEDKRESLMGGGNSNGASTATATASGGSGNGEQRPETAGSAGSAGSGGAAAPQHKVRSMLDV